MTERKLPALGVFIAAMLFVAPAFAEKIAFVDIGRAVGESKDGKAAMAKLKVEVEKRQKELEAQAAEVKKLDEDLAKQRPLLKPEQVEKRQRELQEKVLALQAAGSKTQKELQEREQKATVPIVEKLQKAVALIAARDKYSMVLRQEVLLWPKTSEHDITNQVIKTANEMK
ncbi:MAG: OmpH family outer membrane protein [Deltaproteobacteria bacterium]|nr:OmpH family outer membrane protein [Deltaproteobacteria bacterium]